MQAQKSNIYLPNWTPNSKKTDGFLIPKRILSFDYCGFFPLARFALWSGNAISNEYNGERLVRAVSDRIVSN